MNNKEMLEELDKKVIELDKARKDLREKVVDFEESGEFEKYIAYSDDAKEIMYPEEHKIYLEIAKIDKQADVLVREADDVATKVNADLEGKILGLEAKIKANDNSIKKLEEEIQKTKTDIEELKKSESYINGDQETLMQVQDMEEVLNLKVSQMDRKQKEIESIKKEIISIKEEKKELQELYNIKEGEAISVPNTPEKEEQQEEKEEKKPETDPAETKNKNKPQTEKNGKNKDSSVPTSGEPLPVVEVTEINPGSLKNEFRKLNEKAQKGELTDEEFERYAEILNDKESYDKLELTTGKIFNKSKGLLKTLAMNATKTGPTVKAARDPKNGFGFELKFKDKNGRFLAIDDVKSWSGLKTLANDPEQKIAVEEYLKNITSLNRDELTESQQKIFDDAKKHLGRIAMLRGALATYSEVVEDRKQEKTSWFARRKKVQALPPERDTEEPEVVEPEEAEVSTPEVEKEAPTAFDTLMEELRSQRKEPTAEELEELATKNTTEPEKAGPDIE